MSARRTPSVILAMALVTPALCQLTYPDCYIENVDWTDGTHHIVVPQAIYSPGDGGAPASSTGTANTEFVSATQIRLADGFHAGDLTGEGRFRAHIDAGLGDPDDVVVITHSPTHSIDPVLHTRKWEKLEIGYRLPQEYEDAIESFFDHYYPNASSDDYTSDPDNVDAAQDLNPYADDSLQLLMTLTSPSGVQLMKWGFYMKEADWTSGADDAMLADAPSNPFDAYRIRFRFAPDEEGLWQFSLSIKAPYTSTVGNLPLPEVSYTGYQFVCDPPLPDNNGYLQVNESNGRNLQFQGDKMDPYDQTPFFGLGTNMSDTRKGDWGTWYAFQQRDFDIMKETMEQLHEVGGNFMRVWLMRNMFTPEWVNLGVYDRFKIPPVCDLSESTDPFEPECHTGWTTGYSSSGQYQSWAFDRMLDHARQKGIYLQLCIDPQMPSIDYEKFLWGDHAYVVNYLDPLPRPYDLEKFFYSYVDDDPENAPYHDRGVFYFWKRKYKYIMSRWGYSVNLAIIEPFNEIDQMLTYTLGSGDDVDDDETSTSGPAADCDDTDALDLIENFGTCQENRVVWPHDAALPQRVSDWFTDITGFVRGAQDLGNPVYSSLGDSRPFLLSYAGGSPANNAYHLPFSNDNIDLIDAHRAPDNVWDLLGYAYDAELYRSNSFFMNGGQKKPFHHGEFTSYGNINVPGVFNGATYQFFDNHNTSFHNELWATTFSSCFAAGTSWGWERIFWWKDALRHYPPHLPQDAGNPAGVGHLSNQNANNSLFLGWDGIDPLYSVVRNRPLHHHFKALSDFLSKPSVQALGLFEGSYTTIKHEANGIECIYLMNDDQNLAVGWVHNRSAYWDNSYYITNGVQHYMDCADPSVQEIAIPGFEENTPLKISYFPTWVGQTDVPADEEVNVSSDANGNVTLHLASEELNGTYPLSISADPRNHLDTLHSDYAFIVATDLIKSLRLSPPLDTLTVETDWDFSMYPNPTRGELYLRLPGDAPKSIVIHDIAGRQVAFWGSVSGQSQHLDIGELATGAYWIKVSDGMNKRTKKLLVH